jgi:hypothetical protein
MLCPLIKALLPVVLGRVVVMPSVPVLAGRGTAAVFFARPRFFDLPSTPLFLDAALDTRDSWH